MFSITIFEFKDDHRFNGNKLLQDASKCANGESIDFSGYTKEQPYFCLCWTNQAVDALNQTWNKHYAKGKQIEVVGYKQSNLILHNELKLTAYKSNKLLHKSEYFIVKSFNGEGMTLVNDTVIQKL